MLNKKLLNEILAKYDVKIKKYDHFILAMSHSSYANEHNVKTLPYQLPPFRFFALEIL